MNHSHFDSKSLSSFKHMWTNCRDRKDWHCPRLQRRCSLHCLKFPKEKLKRNHRQNSHEITPVRSPAIFNLINIRRCWSVEAVIDDIAGEKHRMVVGASSVNAYTSMMIKIRYIFFLKNWKKEHSYMSKLTPWRLHFCMSEMNFAHQSWSRLVHAWAIASYGCSCHSAKRHSMMMCSCTIRSRLVAIWWVQRLR